MRPSPFLRRAGGWLATAGAALLAACTSVPLPPMSSPSTPPAPPAGPATAPPPASREATPPATTSAPPRPSEAATPRAYRVDAAAHVYRLNRERIYAGRLPPMLYAIGVLEVDVDARGQVSGLNWRRAPRHAPEVIAEIERTVRAAAPFPAPARLGRVTYTDVWLWDRSGRFQLDTLTEGQD